MAKKNEIRLRITGPDGRTRESTSDQESIILGSGSDAAVRIPDPQVSNVHMMLKVERNGAVRVIDLGSELGTHVGERRVKEPFLLEPGDVISVGGSRVEVASNAAGGPKALEVSMLWGDRVLDVRCFAPGRSVKIGDSRAADFPVFSRSVGASLDFATVRDGSVSLAVPEGSSTTISDGARQRAANGGRTVSLGAAEQARVQLDGVALLVRQVEPPVFVGNQRSEAPDYTFFKIACICLLAGIALVTAFLIAPVDPHSSDDIFLQDAHELAKYLVRPAVAPKPVKLESGAKAEGEEGKFGAEEAKKEEADPSKPGSPIADSKKSEKQRQSVQRIGLLGAVARLGTRDGSSNVFGPGGFGTGVNDSLGGLKGGAGMGDAHGMAGLGMRGTGPGAGGTGLGLGGLGTRGSGRGQDGDGVDLGGLQKEIVKVVPGKTIVVGGLSKEVIFKVVKSHQREIQYCYESELNTHPELAGKVAVQWIIGPDGAVPDASVTETSLGSSRAEECMLTKIRRWRFPEVPGGGIVTVTFPWVFKPAGRGEGKEE